ncbi:MAG: hypothetical protein LBL47_01870 [Lactobacillus sp.]|nr:hypothetical protein [Lactobacillus sp.]
MKKCAVFTLTILVIVLAYVYLSGKKASMDALRAEETMVLKPSFDVRYDASEHLINSQNSNVECEADSEILCAVETMVKCSINPSAEFCSKDKVPDFVFMEDENLGRPTEVSYQITRINPIDENMLEVHTKSNCDGTWFGLCKGNVIYVLDSSKGYIRVKDVYAINL